MTQSKVLLATLASLSLAATAMAQQPPPNIAEVLQKARHNNFAIRAGDESSVSASVSMLEAATAAEPNNADLWVALANAYVRQAEAAGRPGGKAAELFPALTRSRTAFERALKIDPDHAEALAAHGSLQTTFAMFMRNPGLSTQGVAEMNRALELKPSSPVVRLRALTMINLSPELRDRTAELADLQFLQRISGKTPKADYLHLLAGDVQTEAGRPDLARKEYKAADRKSSPAAAEAQSRLTAMDKDGVSATEITDLRHRLNNCVMCHGG